MLRFLLDEHLSPDLVAAVQTLQAEIVVISLPEWGKGRYVGADDRTILAAAYEQGLTLVTYDQKTIPPLLVAWGERATPHAGVVFGSIHTIPTSDIGSLALARALVRLWRRDADLDWTNQVAYLTRGADDVL